VTDRQTDGRTEDRQIHDDGICRASIVRTTGNNGNNARVLEIRSERSDYDPCKTCYALDLFM